MYRDCSPNRDSGYPLLVGIGYMLREAFAVRLISQQSRRQITLGVKDIAVFISIFIDNCLVFVEKLMDTKVDIRRF